MFRMVKRHASRALSAALVTSLCAALVACSHEPSEQAPAAAEPVSEERVLAFGESTHTTTTDPATGAQVEWEIAVAAPQRISGTEAANNIRSPEPQRYSAFYCYPVTLTPVRVDVTPEHATVPVPELKLVTAQESVVRDADGAPVTTTRRANSVPAAPGSAHQPSGDAKVAPRSAAEAYCNIGSGAPSGYTPDLEEGRAYTTVLASWERRVDPGEPATGVALENVRWENR